MSGKKVCINSQSSYYTGKEQSPLHFGLSAEGYEVNSIMEGFDKELWVVEVRNNKKVWTKKEHINKMTYEIPLITELNDARAVSVATDTVADTVATQAIPSAVAAVAAAVSLDDTAISQNNITDLLPAAAAAVAGAAASAARDIATDNDNSKNKEKVSKTMKPTDYTLFITYRIYEMKKTSSDNKKNYDCARYEWKEYKNKPEELRLIMIEANNHSCYSK
jgi:uncharacterized membrane protein